MLSILKLEKHDAKVHSNHALCRCCEDCIEEAELSGHRREEPIPVNILPSIAVGDKVMWGPGAHTRYDMMGDSLSQGTCTHILALDNIQAHIRNLVGLQLPIIILTVCLWVTGGNQSSIMYNNEENTE